MESGGAQQALGWAATDTSGVLSPFQFTRRANGPDDVTIKIIYCGVCHTDLHKSRNEFRTTVYPLVPGIEMTGTVAEVGSNAKEFFKVGERVGVGCMVGACNAKSCGACSQGFQNYCPKLILTSNGVDGDGSRTYGGFSNIIVVNHRYVLRFPDKLPLDAGAPLLGAGITAYSAMKFYGMTENPQGKHLGVVGLGGMGHVAVKMGKALGLKVTVISSSPDKERDAVEHLHADHFLLSKDDQQMKEATSSMEFIIDTVSASHAVGPLLNLLKLHGKLVLLGVPEKPLELPVLTLLYERRMIGGGLAGGIEETQEMLDFCGEHNITCDIEKIPMDYVNTAMERLAKGDVKYRFVIDIAASLK